jgi:polysaccharide biosynthesis protein PslE
MPARQPIDARFVLSALHRFRVRAVAFFVVALAAVVAGVLVAPREYASEARLFLRVGRESVALDPTATMGEKISINDTRQNEINSALEMLRSRELCTHVVDRLGPEIFLDPPPSTDAEVKASGEPSQFAAAWTATVKALESIGALDPVDRQERAIMALGQSLQAYVPRNTNLLAVSCRSATPENAQKIVETVVACFAEMHAQAHRTPQSHDFFIEQSDKLRDRIQTDNEELSRRKNELGLVSLQGQRTLLESERSQVQQQLTAAVGQLAASRAKVQSLESSFEDLPRQEVTEKVDVPNLAIDNMRQLLYQLEIQERESSTLLTENHPKLVSIRQQLKDVKAILADQKNTREQTTTATTPARQPLQVALLMEESEVKSWEAKVKSLQADEERIVADIKNFNTQQIDIERLERDLALAEADYRSYAVRREQARIDQVLAAQQISNLNVVQTPTLVRKPVSPKKLLTISLGMVAGFCGAVCLAVVSARLDRSFDAAAESEASLALPERMEALDRVHPRGVSEAETAADHATV